MSKDYDSFVSGIKETNKSSLEKTKLYLDSLAKPPGSLGKLEDIACKLCSITGSMPSIDKRCIIVLAADNGVVNEGVASAPEAVTAIQTINIAKGVTGVGVLAKQFNTDLKVVDVGVNADLSHPLLENRKIRKSTGNIVREYAMTKDEVKQAILIGIEMVEKAKKEGYKLIGVGEMGIGNTTTSSAVLSSLLGLIGDDISKVVGRGAGLDDTAYQKKINVIKTAIALHKPNKDDVIDVLSKVGGLDIAAMTGVYIGAAYYNLPVVIDGFISVVAALSASKINPLIKEYMFASHRSFEKGYTLAIESLGLSPCLDLNMRLGEGSGVPIMFAVMDASLAVLKNMATFGEAKIDDDYFNTINTLGKSAF